MTMKILKNNSNNDSFIPNKKSNKIKNCYQSINKIKTVG